MPPSRVKEMSGKGVSGAAGQDEEMKAVERKSCAQIQQEKETRKMSREIFTFFI